LLLEVEVFTQFNCGLVKTQDISIVGVPQIREFASEVWETSKLGGTGLILLLEVEVFTRFNCGLVKTQDISVVRVPQIRKFASAVRET
jgi:hypothetical protein